VVAQVRAKVEELGIPGASSLMRRDNALRQAYVREKKKLIGWSGALERQWRNMQEGLQPR
jgi:hypothetical protein